MKNRLAKSAMSDSLANGEGDSTPEQAHLYQRWANGGIGLSIIGEVQGDFRYPEKPGNLVFGKHSHQQALHSLVAKATINGAHLWAQLGHAGALSHTPISQPAGPSALDVGGIKCRALSVDEVRQLPDMFAQTAQFAKAAGFGGVQIHAAHGFLLSQFLSPLFNARQDAYGGSIEARSSIIIKVINKVRKAVGPAFPIGIKINSSDMLEGGLTEAEALDFVRILDTTSVDLIEISGGTYFPGTKASSDGASLGPYFVDFAKQARSATAIPLMATGGFKYRQQAIDALAGGFVDVVGLARALVVEPNLANLWLSAQGGDPVYPRFESTPEGGITAWYTMRITALGEDNEHTFATDPASALALYNQRDTLLCVKWLKRFY